MDVWLPSHGNMQHGRRGLWVRRVALQVANAGCKVLLVLGDDATALRALVDQLQIDHGEDWGSTSGVVWVLSSALSAPAAFGDKQWLVGAIGTTWNLGDLSAATASVVQRADDAAAWCGTAVDGEGNAMHTCTDTAACEAMRAATNDPAGQLAALYAYDAAVTIAAAATDLLRAGANSTAIAGEQMMEALLTASADGVSGPLAFSSSSGGRPRWSVAVWNRRAIASDAAWQQVGLSIEANHDAGWDGAG